jgi:iron complex transport system substrate-binding protein
MTTPRIVSLIASSTEIVCALGFEASLVGRSHECDYPPSVQSLPVCTSPKFKVEGTSREIDDRVKAVLEDALSVYKVDARLLDELRPTHIVTQSQCEVCAVSLKDVERAVCEFTASNPVIVSLEPNALEDLWADIRRVGASLAADERADELVKKLQGRMADIVDKANSIEPRPTVACIEWIDPLMAAGNWMPELVEMADGENLFGEAGKHSPWMSWGELTARQPDIIIVTPCGFDIARSLEDMPSMSSRPEWQNLRAVQTDKVFVADGNQYFNRPGPRLVESLEILAEIFHPAHFQFGHEGKGWIRYQV